SSRSRRLSITPTSPRTWPPTCSTKAWRFSPSTSVRVPELRIALQRTLEDLAAIGEKRVGTPAGMRAAAYLRQRFAGCGIEPTTDPFHFPRHDVATASLDVTIGGATRPIGYDPFEGCGSGKVRGEIVDVGWADQKEGLGDLRGKVALVERNMIYHRSTQYLNV